MLAKNRNNANEQCVCWLHNEKTGETHPIFKSDDLNPDRAYLTGEADIRDYIDYEWFNRDRYPHQQFHIEMAIQKVLNPKLSYNFSPRDEESINECIAILQDKLPKKFCRNVIMLKDDGWKVYPAFTNEENQRDFFLITGPSGAGKTTLAKHLASMYHHILPKNKIIIITQKVTNNKEPIDDLHYETIKKIPYEEWFDHFAEYIPEDPKITKDKKDKKITALPPPDLLQKIKRYKFRDIKTFANSLYIFDDIESVQPKSYSDFLVKAKEMIISLGRADNIQVILCNHMHGNFKGRNDLNQTTHMAFFPPKMTQYHLEYALREYLKYDSNRIKMILNIVKGHRWFVIHKSTFPQVLITDNQVTILSDE